MSSEPSTAAFRRATLAAAARLLWLALLAGAVLLVARDVWNRHTHLQEFAYGCDSWGYLQMAEDFREAWRQRRLSDHGLHHAQIDALVAFVRGVDPRSDRWNQFVAPTCYHYFERAGHVGNQYPPGTAIMLAVSPAGEAVNRLNRFVVVAIAVLAATAMLGFARVRAPLAAGAVAAAAIVTLQVVPFVGHGSYSVNAMLVPGALGVALLFAARDADLGGHRCAALVAAFAAGLALGWFCVVRIASVLVLPGCALVIDRRRWPAFAAGGFLVAFPLLAWNQHTVAGAWWAPTYGAGDLHWASLGHALERALPYYLGGGDGSNWTGDLLLLAAGFAGVALLAGRGAADRALRRRIALAAGLAFGPSILFFVFHLASARYYLAPVAVVVVWILALGALAIERAAIDASSRDASRWRRAWWLVALAPGLFALLQGWSVRDSHPHHEQRRPSLEVPAELRDPNAWIWALEPSGSFWYYQRRPAYKFQFTDPEMRAEAWRYAFGRGDPQFLVWDVVTDRERYTAEIEALGGVLVPRGEVFGQPYARLDWPAWRAGP